MAFYTVLTPPPVAGQPAADQLEKTVFLKDGFAVPAFVFTGLWLLSKRLWLAFLVFALVWLALGFGGPRLGVNPTGLAVAQLLIGLYLGLEGNALVERKLVKQGWTFAGVVEARDLDSAERRFFDVHGAGLPAPAMAQPSPQPQAGAHQAGAHHPSVLGLFPDPRAR